MAMNSKLEFKLITTNTNTNTNNCDGESKIIEFDEFDEFDSPSPDLIMDIQETIDTLQEIYKQCDGTIDQHLLIHLKFAQHHLRELEQIKQTKDLGV